MNLKDEFLEDVSLNKNTYTSKTLTLERLKSIYRTSRKGGIFQNVVEQVFTDLEPVLMKIQSDDLPCSQDSYDDWIIGISIMIGNTLSRNNKGSFGLGQKISNLVMKDHWALNYLSPAFEKYLHVPVDRIIIEKLRPNKMRWNSWTNICAITKNCFEVKQYIKMQESFRQYYLDYQDIFPSLIQMEQFIWHRIRFP